MSSSLKNYSVLTCDQCGATLDSISLGGAGAMALRIHAAANGWQYVQAMVPMPPQHRGKSAVRRSWDFCPDCGIPATLRTTLNVYESGYKTVPVTIIPGGIVAPVVVVADTKFDYEDQP